MSAPGYIAAFDLDKTILFINSSKLVVQVSRKAGIMKTKDYLNAILYSILYKLNLNDPNKLVLSMAMWLKGLDEKNIKGLINEAVIPELEKHIRPVIKEEISFHKKNGARVILLSSAINYLCEPVAQMLGMDDLVCSSMEISDGKFTGKPRGRLIFGEEKKNQMQQYCSKHSFPLDTAWYYGDAMTDRYILEEVGNAVCVRPEWALKRLAKNRGWKII